MTPAEYIDRNPGELLSRLQQLVGVSTVNPPGENYDQVTSWLLQELEDAGVRARRYSIPAAMMKRELPPAQLDYPRFNVLGKLPKALFGLLERSLLPPAGTDAVCSKPPGPRTWTLPPVPRIRRIAVASALNSTGNG